MGRYQSTVFTGIHETKVEQEELIKELNWINTARQFIGLREVKGTKHNPATLPSGSCYSAAYPSPFQAEGGCIW